MRGRDPGRARGDNPVPPGASAAVHRLGVNVPVLQDPGQVVVVVCVIFLERFSRSLFWSSVFPFHDRVGDCVGASETQSTSFGADCRHSCRRFLSRLLRW